MDALLRNLALSCGFLVAAILMVIGIIDHKRILEEARAPQRHATATFFVAILILYFATFMVLAIAQCIDGFKIMFSPHKITPLDQNPDHAQP